MASPINNEGQRRIPGNEAGGRRQDRPNAKRRWLQRLSNRLQFGLFVKSYVDALVIFLFSFGVIVLVSKIFWPNLWTYTLWLGILLIPIAVKAYWASRQRAFSQQQSVAILDQRIGANGLLMTIMETPDQNWESHLPAAESIWRDAMPRFRPLRALRHLALPVLFLLVSWLIPPRPIQSFNYNPSPISATEVAQLQEMLTNLDENEVLQTEEKDELEEEIRKLTEETKFTPLTHEDWQTVDAIKEKMRQRVRDRENQLSKAASALGALRRSLDDPSGNTSKEKQILEEALANLAGAAGIGDNQNSANQTGQENNSASMGQIQGDGQFNLPDNPQQLRAALDDLQNYIESQCQCVGNSPGSCFGSEFSNMMSQCMGNQPGRGGISRGRGDAELTWGDESDEQGVLFRDIAMPMGIPDRQGELLETKLTEPEANPQSPNSRSRARTVVDATGQESWKRALRPRHREIVKKYFDSKNDQ